MPELVSETFAFAKIPLVPIAKALYPVLHDLEIDSKALDALKNDYLGLPDNEKAIAKASAVVLAEKDRVVEPARFADDPISGQYDDKGHIDVCKPDANFTKPLETVAKILP